MIHLSPFTFQPETFPVLTPQDQAFIDLELLDRTAEYAITNSDDGVFEQARAEVARIAVEFPEEFAAHAAKKVLKYRD